MVYLNGEPLSYFAAPISEGGVEALGIVVGDAKHQAALEFLALLIGVRLWKGYIGKQRWAVAVETDSTSALGAACKLRSSAPA